MHIFFGVLRILYKLWLQKSLYPVELEKVLFIYPAILDVAVTGNVITI